MDLCGGGNVLYLDSVNVSILPVILYHSFARCPPGGKLDKRYTGSPCIVSYNSI